MKTTPTSPPKSERGQSLLELAVSLVILLMLLTGSVEFGMALFQYIAIRDAAQEGAVFASIGLEGPGVASVDTTDGPGAIKQIKWRVMQAADDVVKLNIEDVHVLINGTEFQPDAVLPADACEGRQPDNKPNVVEVVAYFNHPITFPFVADMIGQNHILLRGDAVNTILTPVCP